MRRMRRGCPSCWRRRRCRRWRARTPGCSGHTATPRGARLLASSMRRWGCAGRLHQAVLPLQKWDRLPLDDVLCVRVLDKASMGFVLSQLEGMQRQGPCWGMMQTRAHGGIMCLRTGGHRAPEWPGRLARPARAGQARLWHDGRQGVLSHLDANSPTENHSRVVCLQSCNPALSCRHRGATPLHACAGPCEEEAGVRAAPGSSRGAAAAAAGAARKRQVTTAGKTGGRAGAAGGRPARGGAAVTHRVKQRCMRCTASQHACK